MTDWFTPVLLLSETNSSKITLLSDKLLKWSPVLALSSFPDLLVFGCFWFNFSTFGAFSCTGSIRRGVWLPPAEAKISYTFVSSFQAGRNFFILPVRTDPGIFCLKNIFFRIG